jgi:hypothetical protein
MTILQNVTYETLSKKGHFRFTEMLFVAQIILNTPYVPQCFPDSLVTRVTEYVWSVGCEQKMCVCHFWVEEGTAGEHGDFAEMVVSQNRSLYQP